MRLLDASCLILTALSLSAFSFHGMNLATIFVAVLPCCLLTHSRTAVHWQQHHPTSSFIGSNRYRTSLTMSMIHSDIVTVTDSIIHESESILNRTNRYEAFTVDELASLSDSFHNLALLADHDLDYKRLIDFAARSIHLSFKQSFSTTAAAAQELGGILPLPGTVPFRDMFHRVLTDGGWDSALEYASIRSQLGQQAASSLSPSSSTRHKPWAVLVTGLNGIRKTTSINSPWFRQVLYDALSPQLAHTDITIDDLPVGSNSFFRQLDFLVATVANNEFKRLYSLNDVKSYATLKNAIFARYRNLAEICGMMLIDKARNESMNVLMETSGRDIAMFDYLNYCFPSDQYNRLVVHFTINDIQFAERSVDNRMIAEMEAGRRSLSDRDGGGVIAQVAANAGGPYGSSQLRAVQADSDRVADLIFNGNNGGSDSHSGTTAVATATSAAAGWFKARISITARDQGVGPWTIRANADGSREFSFPT